MNLHPTPAGFRAAWQALVDTSPPLPPTVGPAVEEMLAEIERLTALVPDDAPDGDEVYVADHGSVDVNYFEQSLDVAAWKDPRALGSSSRVLLRVTAPALPNWFRQVTGHALELLSHVSVETQVGDCATCGNRRLVDQDRNGRSTTVRCPDCSERTAAARPFAAAPRLRHPGPRPEEGADGRSTD